MTLDTWIMLATTVAGFLGTYAALRRDLGREFRGELRRVEDTLTVRIDGVEQSLGARIDGVEQSLGARIDGVEQRLGRVEDRVERLDDRVYALAVGLRPTLDRESSSPE